MPRCKRFIDMDVLTAARLRIAHVFDTFDKVVTCFSGGKDSLTVLHMVKAEAEKRGELPIKVIFRDEELIPDEVIRFVDEYRRKDWIDMDWYAVPLRSQKFILGKAVEYVQWDPKRRHVRPKPPWAISLPGSDTRIFDQYTMDAFAARAFKGKVAFMNGIRAAESLTRFRACVNKLNENYINASPVPNVSLVKPIYDWQENDIFKFFYDMQQVDLTFRYCPIYDAQHLAGENLRVSTPLHAEASKRFASHRVISPVFYQQVMDVFPEMALQERYWSQINHKAVEEEYGKDFEGVRRYIDEHLDATQREKALDNLDTVLGLARKSPEAYPAFHVLKWVQGGAFKRLPMPLNKTAQAQARKRLAAAGKS